MILGAGLLFLVNVFFHLYKVGVPELSGDEAASYLSLIPFLKFASQGRFVPSFLVYFHEPLQLLVQIPFVFGGLIEELARLPNIISGILIFIVLAKIWRKFFSKALLPLLFLLTFYTISGYFFLSRLAINIGLFGLIATIFIYYTLQFVHVGSGKNIKNPLVALFLGSFVFIDAILMFPGFIFLLLHRSKKDYMFYIKPITYFVLATGLAVVFWFEASFFGSLISGVYDWRLVAPARLFFRGANFGYLSVRENYEALISFSDPIFVFGLVSLAILSLLNKRSRIVWKLILVPLIFFDLVKTPTLHLLLFYPLIILLAASGWNIIWERTQFIGKGVLILISVVVAVVNMKFILSRFSLMQPYGYKQAGSFIAKMTDPCDVILTDIEGYSFRLYFGRRYINTPDSHVRFAVAKSGEKLESTLSGLGFGLLARTAIGNPPITVYQMNYSGTVRQLRGVNQDQYPFVSLLPYLGRCSL